MSMNGPVLVEEDEVLWLQAVPEARPPGLSFTIWKILVRRFGWGLPDTGYTIL